MSHVALWWPADDQSPGARHALPDLSEHRALVSQLFVAPRAQGRGIGAALLTNACSEAGARNLCPALEVLDHDRSAIPQYERMGWHGVASSPAMWALPGDAHP